jgi:hypothetical protein
MNKKLERVLIVLKSRALIESTTDVELAKLSALSRQFIHKSKSNISLYLVTAPQPSKADEALADKQYISTYVYIALTSGIEKSHFGQVTGAVAGLVLRKYTNLINDIHTPKKLFELGKNT